MKALLLACVALVPSVVFGDTPDVSIPARDGEIIRTADEVDVTGTNDLGGPESFSIHDAKAIRQFVEFLTSDRYTAVPKSLKPDFKSLSAYQIRLLAKGNPIFELRVIAESVLDISAEPVFYMQADPYSDNLMAPLMRLR